METQLDDTTPLHDIDRPEMLEANAAPEWINQPTEMATINKFLLETAGPSSHKTLKS